ncbi:MAG: phosphoglycerate kinase [Candidatus Cloacimonetes bacterium]|jgi:phosphoglycerate kinase|nr:phosphoglycerate kinase [Candidatus Cloacimonadota bacterium]
MLDADLNAKVVLIRFDHNVVKKGKIKDPMRIDATIPTLLHVFKKGGLPILMTHVGRPLDKATKTINISDNDSVLAIVNYLNQKLQLKGCAVELKAGDEYGITDLSPLAEAVESLKNGKCDYLYLPNTRWFKGEEAKDENADIFAKALASYADIYINDAFGSWQPHASTFHIAKYLPAYAGLLMEKEIVNLEKVFSPQQPLVAVVAGSKFDTKIGPLSALIKGAKTLVLGGVIYNAYLAAKYGLNITGIGEDDIAAAQRFIDESKNDIAKVLELPYLVVSQSIEERKEGSWEVKHISELRAMDNSKPMGYILDAAPESFCDETVVKCFSEAGSFFVNAVMGFSTLFPEGSMAMYSLIDQNKDAVKLFGGGDTIQDFRTYLPGIFAQAQNDEKYYFFTGGGAVLTSIESGSAQGMKPVQALIK